MLQFIGIEVYDNSNPDPNIPSRTSFSHSNLTHSDRLCVKGMLPHNAEISFNKENAQKMIDFCQKIISQK